MLTPNQEQFIYWITERNNIRLKKEAGLPAPWSDNPVMQETYFCNVNREDDRVTKWIRDNWQYGEDLDAFMHKTSFTFSMIVARIFNLPSTLEALMQPIDDELPRWIENAEDVLLELKADGKTIFNGAYIISTNGRKIDKITHVLDIFDRLIITDNVDPVAGCKTLKEAHTELMKVYGLASFLAAQVVADLKNSSGHPLQQAPDWWSFSAFGPGSLRGLSWFWDKPITKSTYQKAIDDQYDLIELELPDEIISRLHHQDLQNCNCEFDKFMRVSNGTGRSKRIYRKGK